jgi:hypothetical protein
MNSVIFKIDQNKLNFVWKRQLKRILKIIIPGILITQSLIYLTNVLKGDAGLSPQLFIISMLISSLFLAAISIYMTRLVTKSLMNLEYEINADGVFKTHNSVAVQIPWEKLETRLSSYGELILIDKRVKKIVRWWSGTGKIPVLPELEHFDEFQELIKRAISKYNN